MFIEIGVFKSSHVLRFAMWVKKWQLGFTNQNVPALYVGAGTSYRYGCEKDSHEIYSYFFLM